MKERKITLTEDQLIEIVGNAVEAFLKEEPKGESLRIESDVPLLEAYEGSHDNDEFVRSQLEEGLIKTYGIEYVENIIRRKFHLDSHQFFVTEKKDEENTVEIITILLPSTTSKNIIGELIHTMRTCGYFPVNKFKPSRRDPRYGTITFEPKYTEDISSEIRKKYQYLYHSTPSVLLDKIKLKGLIPRSGNSLFLYPDRIFFMNGDKLSKVQINSLINIQRERNKTNPDLKNPKDNLEYSLVRIKVSSIPKDVKMYKDPVTFNGIFVYDNIPPSAIDKITPFSLPTDETEK